VADGRAAQVTPSVQNALDRSRGGWSALGATSYGRLGQAVVATLAVICCCRSG
jgi:hypothetical protein